MRKFHYGVWVDSETPITGVTHVNKVDLDYLQFCTCLDCESANEENECQPNHITLWGDWLKVDGRYELKPDAKIAVIMSEVYAQVVFSTSISTCKLCSPCYPGQGDLESQGEFKTFSLGEFEKTLDN